MPPVLKKGTAMIRVACAGSTGQDRGHSDGYEGDVGFDGLLGPLGVGHGGARGDRRGVHQGVRARQPGEHRVDALQVRQVRDQRQDRPGGGLRAPGALLGAGDAPLGGRRHWLRQLETRSRGLLRQAWRRMLRDGKPSTLALELPELDEDEL